MKKEERLQHALEDTQRWVFVFQNQYMVVSFSPYVFVLTSSPDNIQITVHPSLTAKDLEEINNFYYIRVKQVKNNSELGFVQTADNLSIQANDCLAVFRLA